MSKKNNKPLVSVIMSIYNTEEAVLREAINSILNQTYRNLEIIIINDGSDSKYKYQFISDYNDRRIFVYKNETNRGLAYSLNYAIKKSKGKYLARMDSDDIALMKRIEKQVEFMEKNPNVAVLGTRAKDFGELDNLRASIPNSPRYLRTYLLYNSCIVHPTVLIRRSFLEKNQLTYNEKYLNSQDYELWARCQDYGNVIWELPECLLAYRISDNQISSKKNNHCQLENARKIREEQLKKMGIVPDEKEKILHNILSEGKSDKNIILSELLNWCIVIIKKNKISKYYDLKELKLATTQQLLAIVISNKINWDIDLIILLRVIVLLNINLIIAVFYKILRKVENLFVKGVKKVR